MIKTWDVILIIDIHFYFTLKSYGFPRFHVTLSDLHSAFQGASWMSCKRRSLLWMLIPPFSVFLSFASLPAGSLLRETQHHRQHCDHFLPACVRCRGRCLPGSGMGVGTQLQVHLSLPQRNYGNIWRRSWAGLSFFNPTLTETRFVKHCVFLNSTPPILS